MPNSKAFFIIRQLKRFNCRLIYFENTFPFFFCRCIINLQEEQNKGETMKIMIEAQKHLENGANVFGVEYPGYPSEPFSRLIFLGFANGVYVWAGYSYIGGN